MQIEIELNPKWDANKEIVLKEAPEGSFNPGDINKLSYGDTMTNIWFKGIVKDEVIGYGLLDQKNEFQIFLKKSSRNKGYGTQLMSKIESYSIENNYTKIYATIEKTNPKAKEIINWLHENKYNYEASLRASTAQLNNILDRIESVTLFKELNID